MAVQKVPSDATASSGPPGVALPADSAAAQSDVTPRMLSPSDAVTQRLQQMRVSADTERDLGATCDVSADGNARGVGCACCAGAADASTTRLPQAALALGSAVGVATCRVSACAIACDGIEQAYLPTPLSDPPMDDAEVCHLPTSPP